MIGEDAMPGEAVSGRRDQRPSFVHDRLTKRCGGSTPQFGQWAVGSEAQEARMMSCASRMAGREERVLSSVGRGRHSISSC